MNKIIARVLLTLLCITTNLSARLIDELDGMQQIECAIAPFSHPALERAQKKPFPHEKHNIHASTFTHIPLKNGTSLNWSGYAAATNLARPATGSVSDVYGSWTVPTLTSATGTSYVSLWVGIDGYSSSTVEQLGTLHVWNGSQQNFSWFEMYPKGAYEIVGFPTNPGDVMAAEVFYSGSGRFNLSLVNYTRNVYTVVPASYTKNSSALRSSAEWIVEAPSSNTGVLPLANFGTAVFTNCSATINSITGHINNTHWKNDPLTMQTNTHVIKATPSSLLNSGTSFSVQWNHK